MYSHIHSKWFPNDSISSNFHLTISFHENSRRLGMLHADRHIGKAKSRESSVGDAFVDPWKISEGNRSPKPPCWLQTPFVRPSLSVQTVPPQSERHTRPWDLCGCLECETFVVWPSVLDLVHLQCSWICSNLG